MDVQLFDLSWVICFTICGLRIGRPYFMSVFYSTTFLLLLSFCCLFVPFSFSRHCVYILSVFFNLCCIVNLVLVTSELLGTTDPGCNRIGYVMFKKFVLQEIVILLRFLHHFCVYVLLFSIGRCRSSGSICFCGDSVWQQRQSYSCECMQQLVRSFHIIDMELQYWPSWVGGPFLWMRVVAWWRLTCIFLNVLSNVIEVAAGS